MSTFHRDGEILEELLNELGFKKAELARRLDKHINSLRYMMENGIPNDVLIEMGKILRYDMTAKYARLKSYQPAMEATYQNEPHSPYMTKLNEIEKQVSSKEQAIADQQLEIRMLKEKIQDMKAIIDAKNDIISDKNLIIDQLNKEIERLKSGPKGNGHAA